MINRIGKKDKPKELSIYGFENGAECMAESIAEYLTGYSRSFAERIVSIYKIFSKRK